MSAHLWKGCRAFADGADVHVYEARTMVRDLLREVDRLYSQMLANGSPMALREAERAAIVKWLRERWGEPPEVGIEGYVSISARGECRDCADAIERGEHLK